jgi:hypothetical protein
MTDFDPLQDIPPNTPHWKGDADSLPTFPEGAWTDNFAYVATVLHPGHEYQVEFEGTYWNARPLRDGTTLQVDERVRVLGREGNELIVDKGDGGKERGGGEMGR